MQFTLGLCHVMYANKSGLSPSRALCDGVLFGKCCCQERFAWLQHLLLSYFR